MFDYMGEKKRKLLLLVQMDSECNRKNIEKKQKHMLLLFGLWLLKIYSNLFCLFVCLFV